LLKKRERQLPDNKFNQGILNALSARIAVLDHHGRIEVVNQAWLEFGADHALGADKFGVGLNYLAACENARGDGADEAGRMSAGIRAVLRGEKPLFELEYSCHSPTRLSWFKASVTPIAAKNRLRALVAHVDVTERVLVEQALKKAELEQRDLAAKLARERERSTTAQSVAKLGSWEINLLTSEIFWSEETYRIFEISRDHFSHTPDGVVAFIHPDDRNAVAAAIEASLTTREITSIDLRLLMPDGQVKYVNATWQAFLEGNDFPVRAIGTCQDISERHAANEKLLQSEQELRQSRLHLSIAQRVASIGSAAIDFRTGKWDWSDETFRIYGLEPGAITPSADSLGARVHPEDRAGLLSNIPLAKIGITPPPLEYRIMRPDGLERLLRREATLVRDEAGNVTGIVGAVQDVTELRAAQLAKEKADSRLKEQAAMLSNAQRIGRMGSWSLNHSDHRLVWSDATYELFGITPEEFEGSFDHFLKFIIPEDLPSYREAQTRVSPQTPLIEAQYRIRRPDGEVRWMYDRGNVSFDANGNELARIGMVSDITEQRNLEAQLRNAMRLEAIGQLTGGLAHDFNNLLTVVLGNAETLSLGLKDNEQLYPLVQVTMRAAERGAELTRRLLAFARRQPLAPKMTNINDLLLGMKVLLRQAIEGDVDIEWDCDEKLWCALIDGPQLENVLLNLCINARDAMPGGGRLTISTKNAQLEENKIGPDTELIPGQYVQIAISDTGTGMDPQTLARVFEPFFTTKGVGKGSGLGLSMAYGFIKQSNGQIKIDSEPGRGTTVYLYLPMVLGSVDRDEPDADRKVSPKGNEKVLMVEDDYLVRLHVAGMLRRLGYQVTEVANGLEALEILKGDEDYSLLFTDLLLPGGLSGRQLADAARRLRPKIAVLMTSGYSKELLNQPSRESDFLLIKKPYRINELAVMLRRALRPEPETVH
jgi:PAS domain S-box-containing protein